MTRSARPELMASGCTRSMPRHSIGWCEAASEPSILVICSLWSPKRSRRTRSTSPRAGSRRKLGPACSTHVATIGRRFPRSPFARRSKSRPCPKRSNAASCLHSGEAHPTSCATSPSPVHRAFGIPLAENRPEVLLTPRAPEREHEPRRPTPHVDEDAAAVIAWRDGAELPAEQARILRRAFRDAIVGAADLEDALVSQQLVQEFFSADTDIRIKRSRGSGRPGPERFAVEFDPSNEHALLFLGVLRAQQRKRWTVDDGHTALVDFLARVDSEAAQLRMFLAERLAERSADQDAAIALLAVAGLAVGQGTTSDARGLLAAALSADAILTDEMPPRWQTLLSQLASRRDATRAFATQGARVTRGVGEPAGVDGARFLPALSTLRSGWTLPELSERAPQAVLRFRREIDERLEPALGEVREFLTGWHREVGRLVGDPETVSDRARGWRAAVKAAADAGLLSTARGFTPESPFTNLGSTCRSVATLLVEWDTYDFGRRLNEIARIPWTRLEPLRAQLTGLEATLRASAERAASQQGGDEDGSPIERFEQAVDRLATAVA